MGGCCNGKLCKVFGLVSMELLLLIWSLGGVCFSVITLADCRFMAIDTTMIEFPDQSTPLALSNIGLFFVENPTTKTCVRTPGLVSDNFDILFRVGQLMGVVGLTTGVLCSVLLIVTLFMQMCCAVRAIQYGLGVLFLIGAAAQGLTFLAVGGNACGRLSCTISQSATWSIIAVCLYFIATVHAFVVPFPDEKICSRDCCRSKCCKKEDKAAEAADEEAPLPPEDENKGDVAAAAAAGAAAGAGTAAVVAAGEDEGGKGGEAADVEAPEVPAESNDAAKAAAAGAAAGAGTAAVVAAAGDDDDKFDDELDEDDMAEDFKDEEGGGTTAAAAGAIAAEAAPDDITEVASGAGASVAASAVEEDAAAAALGTAGSTDPGCCEEEVFASARSLVSGSMVKK